MVPEQGSPEPAGATVSTEQMSRPQDQVETGAGATNETAAATAPTWGAPPPAPVASKRPAWLRGRAALVVGALGVAVVAGLGGFGVGLAVGDGGAGTGQQAPSGQFPGDGQFPGTGDGQSGAGQFSGMGDGQSGAGQLPGGRTGRGGQQTTPDTGTGSGTGGTGSGSTT
ncbi:hypothetical protein GCM10010428_02450 [Actinosynnema pretiosum subsp. pretiosum]